MHTSFLSLHSCHSLSPWFCDCGSWVPCFAYIYNRKLFYPLSENCLWLILTERPSSFLSLRTIFAVRRITGLVNFIQATLIVLTKNFAHLEENITKNGFVWFTCKRLLKEYLSFELLTCWQNVLNCTLGSAPRKLLFMYLHYAPFFKITTTKCYKQFDSDFQGSFNLS